MEAEPTKELRFVEREEVISSSFSLPDDVLLDSKEYNTDDLKATRIIHFTTDLNDEWKPPTKTVKVLQQRWIDGWGQNYYWKDVPTVKEETDNKI